MKRRCVFSVAIVITLAALSVVAFANSLTGMPTNENSEQRPTSETASIIEPETTTEPRQAVIEVAPTDNHIEVAYQSMIASLECRRILFACKIGYGRGRE